MRLLDPEWWDKQNDLAVALVVALVFLSPLLLLAAATAWPR